MQDELRESHFEAVVIGTGLTQSIVAAALAAASKPIIHVDESEAYGGPHASLTLSELASFNPTFHPSLVSRQYSLSLTPHLIPATGPFIAALVNSGVSRYGSFVLPKRVVIQTKDGFKNPANKQDVFKDKTISLVQKRRLIKFLMFATGEFEQSPELEGKETTPLLEFVRDVFGIDKELAEALDQTLPALVRTRTYLRSVGRYGPSPFLIGHYGGAGELAQGFCRTCAVQGGTQGKEGEGKEEEAQDEATHRSWTSSSGKTFTSYHPPSTFETYGTEGVDVSSTEVQTEAGLQTQTEASEPNAQNEQGGKKTEIHPPTPTGPYFRIRLEGFAAPFTANTIIGSDGWLAHILDESNHPGTTPHEPKFGNTIRAILVIDAPATFASASEQSVSSDQPAGEDRLDESIIILPSEEGAVSVLVNGASTMSCPDGKCDGNIGVLYFTAQSAQDPKEYFAKYISAVLDACSLDPKHADPSRELPSRQGQPSSYSTTHLTEGPDAAAREAEQVFWDALGDQPGEDGKGKDGVEFFARIEREEDLFDD
ncbi:GDP dissociation inhibitor [Rhizoctonia solani]|uniref:GDP dissociation inhibitor n=1 Tax=Rhizoctonia solani TaxID=456999 RepID=A0A8H7IN80_9AGAM|nr:GDP dissociation inhibitor [Rhizoctonia solani]